MSKSGREFLVSSLLLIAIIINNAPMAILALAIHVNKGVTFEKKI